MEKARHTAASLKAMLADIQDKVESNYRGSFFYEAQLELLPNSESGYGPMIDWDSSKVIYGRTDGTTLQIVFKDCKPYFQEIPEPWLEDRAMTVYIPCDLKDAYDRLLSADFICDSKYCTLRFQLDPKFVEPQYIFGTANNCHTVGVYSADVK